MRRSSETYAGKRELSVSDGIERIFRELRGMGVGEYGVIISTNVPVRNDGLPRSGMAQPTDPGVAVYWEKKGKSQCMAIDRYDRVADNLAAVAATLEAMRAIERHGGAQVMDRAFLGFAQLPESVRKPWRDVLQFPPSATVSWDAIEERYRALARKRHPDQGGSSESFHELTQARTDALLEMKTPD